MGKSLSVWPNPTSLDLSSLSASLTLTLRFSGTDKTQKGMKTYLSHFSPEHQLCMTYFCRFFTQEAAPFNNDEWSRSSFRKKETQVKDDFMLSDETFMASFMGNRIKIMSQRENFASGMRSQSSVTGIVNLSERAWWDFFSRTKRPDASREKLKLGNQTWTKVWRAFSSERGSFHESFLKAFRTFSSPQPQIDFFPSLNCSATTLVIKTGHEPLHWEEKNHFTHHTPLTRLSSRSLRVLRCLWAWNSI